MKGFLDHLSTHIALGDEDVQDWVLQDAPVTLLVFLQGRHIELLGLGLQANMFRGALESASPLASVQGNGIQDLGLQRAEQRARAGICV